LRKKSNKSGSVSVQIISKNRSKYKVEKTIGSSNNDQELQKLWFLGKQALERLNIQSPLCNSENDLQVEQVFNALENASIKTVGPKIIFEKIYNHIGFNSIEEDLFRHLVIARLAYPLSKLRTIEYLYRYQSIHLDIDPVYRFLYKLNSKLNH
jgi:hypothetical protein